MMFHRSLKLTVLMIAASAMNATTARGENVDLSTIPGRDTVQLTIYNNEDLTLVRETRHITFSEGINPLQFSWANTLIDPTSVELRFRTHQDELDVLDTTYPHDKPQMLYWNVRSGFDGDAVIEITYFTSGITWAADYVCIADPGEDEMSFDGFVKITNNSGEDYADAQVRLVVGEINLVEKIADLARRGLISDDEAKVARRGGRLREMPAPARQELGMEMESRFAMADAASPKEIVKEGLSEYFIYTIEGTETVPNGWSKRMRLFQGTSVPFDIEYRFRTPEYGNQLVRLYILRNTEENNLGSTPLPDGIVRLFRETGRDSLSFLTAYQTKYVPIGQEIELNLGVDPEVIHERIRMKTWRDNFWFRKSGSNQYFSPEHGDRILPRYDVAGWDEHDRWTERIRNYRHEPIEVEIRRSYDGDIDFQTNLDVTMHDYRTPQLTATIAAGAELNLIYTVTVHQGYNAKQNRVRLND
jgi:hypothetical protein